MKHQKPLIRRTFLQERFEILMKKQQSGEASFNELTELDEIVNRDPKLRYIILEEMKGSDCDNIQQEEIMLIEASKPQNLFDKLKSLINHLLSFNAQLFQLA